MRIDLAFMYLIQPVRQGTVIAKKSKHIANIWPACPFRMRYECTLERSDTQFSTRDDQEHDKGHLYS